MIKRVSGILTPPPFRKQDKPAEAPYTDPEHDFDAELRGLVRTLISAESEKSPEIQQLIAEIKRLGREKGPYATAARMRIQLESLVQRAEEGKPCHPDRGYRLAADFIVHQVVNEIDGIKTTGSLLGPNILKHYCTDLTSCLIDAHDIRRAIEIGIMVAERALWHAIGETERKPVFLGLVEPPLHSARELIEYKLDRDTQRERQQSHVRGKHKRPEEQDEGQIAPTSAEMSELDGIEAALSYLKDVHKRSLAVREAFLRYDGVPYLSRDALTESVEAARVSKHLEYLKGLQGIAETERHLSFCSLVNEEAGAFMMRVDVDHGRRMSCAAARNYEALGDAEAAVSLKNLAKTRYKKAYPLYEKGQDAAGAERVRAKLQTH